MADLSALAVDVAKQEDGAWVEYRFGVRLKVRSMSAESVHAAFAEERRAVAQGIRAGTIADGSHVDILMKVAAFVLLADWAELELDGQPLPFSHEKAHELFLDPRYRHIGDFVIATASSWETFRAASLEASKGN
jgi:hypothetical protein